MASLKEAGFQKAKVVVGIDYSKSNDFTGRLTNNARPLHDINEDGDNAYQQVCASLSPPPPTIPKAHLTYAIAGDQIIRVPTIGRICR